MAYFAIHTSRQDHSHVTEAVTRNWERQTKESTGWLPPERPIFKMIMNDLNRKAHRAWDTHDSASVSTFNIHNSWSGMESFEEWSGMKSFKDPKSDEAWLTMIKPHTILIHKYFRHNDNSCMMNTENIVMLCLNFFSSFDKKFASNFHSLNGGSTGWICNMFNKYYFLVSMLRKPLKLTPCFNSQMVGINESDTNTWACQKSNECGWS